MVKYIKFGVIGLVATVLLGGFVFGRDLISYAHTSANSVRTAVKGNVPVEFELQRAGDLIDEILPEVHANIRRVAQEEVELAALRADIDQSESSVADQRIRLSRLRQRLDTQQASYEIGSISYNRDQVRSELARRLEHLKEAELMLASKRRLLTAREESLAAAIEQLDQARMRKAMLEDKVQTLAAQHRLVQASSAGTGVQFSQDKIAQTERLLTNIQKRLDVAERVMAREAQFVERMAIDEPLGEPELLADVDAYLREHPQTDADDAAIRETLVDARNEHGE